MDKKLIGHLIQQKRKEKGLSQSQLNKLLGYEETSKFISQIERGVVGFPERKLPLFAKHLNIPETALYHMLHPHMPNICYKAGVAEKVGSFIHVKSLQDVKNLQVNPDLLKCLTYEIKGNFLRPVALDGQKVILSYSSEIEEGDFVILSVNCVDDDSAERLDSFIKANKQYLGVSTKRGVVPIFGKVLLNKEGTIKVGGVIDKKSSVTLRKKDLNIKIRIAGVLF